MIQIYECKYLYKAAISDLWYNLSRHQSPYQINFIVNVNQTILNSIKYFCWFIRFAFDLAEYTLFADWYSRYSRHQYSITEA